MVAEYYSEEYDTRIFPEVDFSLGVSPFDIRWLARLDWLALGGLYCIDLLTLLRLA